ncbi:hypothetical protein NWF32_15555 [Pseudomonas qingdaonensis]|nr:hypothetical protein [Pseudomonas qingdaonensis]
MLISLVVSSMRSSLLRLPLYSLLLTVARVLKSGSRYGGRLAPWYRQPVISGWSGRLPER